MRPKPAEINGTVLCIFDPNCKFLPDVSENKPGAMYDKVKILQEKFPDVFSGYMQNVPKYNISEEGNIFPISTQE